MKYKIYKQPDEKNCGVACLAMICAYYGVKNMSLAVIRNFAKTDREGNSMYSLKLAAEKLHLQTDAYYASKQDILSNQVQLPVIVHTLIDSVDQHYMVLFEANKNYVVLGDPAEGLVKMSWRNFCRIWTFRLMTFRPTENFKENKKYKRNYKLIYSLIFKYKKYLFMLLLLSAIASGISVIAASFYSSLIDTIIPNANLNLLTQMVLVISGIYIFTSIVNWIKLKISITFNKKLDKELTLDIYTRITNLPMIFFSTRTSGDLITRFQDGNIIRSVITDYTSDFIIDIVYAIFALAAVILNDSWQIVIIALTMVVLILFVHKLFGNKLSEQTKKIKSYSTDIYSFANASFTGSETVKSYNSENNVQNNMTQKYTKYQNLFYKNKKMFRIQSDLFNIIIDISQLLMLSALGIMVMQNKLSMGNLMFLYTLQGYLLGPVGRIIGIQDKLYETYAAIERLDDVYKTQTENELNKNKSPLVGNIKKIEFKDVTFQYGFREPILNNISFCINKGESIGIIGESGSGKTTLIKLILKFYEVTEGKIYINDCDINDITSSSIRDKVAYVSQNDFWFQDTIFNNLTIGNPSATEEEVNRVLTIAKMKEYINRKPLGIKTKIEEGATNLSTGEKQRLSLAKALITNPDVLILDESTSNLDTLTEEYIIDNLAKETDKIKVVVAHRLNILSKCDKILCLKDGYITEIGTPEELIASKGVFYTLWKKQNNYAI